MRQFEYHSEAIAWNRIHGTIAARLNELGREGWRVIDLEWLNGHNHLFVTCEREVEEADRMVVSGFSPDAPLEYTINDPKLATGGRPPTAYDERAALQAHGFTRFDDYTQEPASSIKLAPDPRAIPEPTPSDDVETA